MTKNSLNLVFFFQVEMGSFITTMGVEKFRKEFMPQEGIPGFVWYIDFKARLAIFTKEFTLPIESLKAGEMKTADGGACSIL